MTAAARRSSPGRGSNPALFPCQLNYLALLSSHPDTHSAVLENGEPEARLAFDRRIGEVRNAELAVRAASNSTPLALTIEAKADEPFDKLVPDTLADALDRILERGRGGGIDRVRDLATSLLPPPASRASSASIYCDTSY